LNIKTSEKPPNDQTITYDSYDERNRLLQKTVGQWADPRPPSPITAGAKPGKLDTMTDPSLRASTDPMDLSLLIE
jgi:hypothetical protein